MTDPSRQGTPGWGNFPSYRAGDWWAETSPKSTKIYTKMDTEINDFYHPLLIDFGPQNEPKPALKSIGIRSRIDPTGARTKTGTG